MPLAPHVDPSCHALLDGPEAGKDATPSARRTAGGATVDASAAFFRGALAAGAIGFLRPAGPGLRTLTALATSSLAGIVDYGLVPQRLSPGWELVRRRKDIALVLASMGAGIAAAALADGFLEERHARD